MQYLAYPVVISALTSLSCSHLSLPCKNLTILYSLQYPAATQKSCTHITLPQSLHCPAVTSLSCSHSTLLQSPQYPAATLISCSHHTILQPPFSPAVTTLSSSNLIHFFFIKPLFTRHVHMNTYKHVSFLMFLNLQVY